MTAWAAIGLKYFERQHRWAECLPASARSGVARCCPLLHLSDFSRLRRLPRHNCQRRNLQTRGSV